VHDEATYDSFLTFVKSKHKSPWNAFSRELRQNIVEYLDRHEKEYIK